MQVVALQQNGRGNYSPWLTTPLQTVGSDMGKFKVFS
jgi:hypothetical protein